MMQNLELDSATSIKIEASSLRRHRPYWRSGTVGVLVLFIALAVCFLAVAYGGDGSSQQRTQESMTQLQPQQQVKGSEPPTSLNNDEVTTMTDPCDNLYDCQTDRLGHNTPLLRGQALCNDIFRFGITHDGVFQWHNCAAPLTKVIYENSTIFYFTMTSHGALQLIDDDDMLMWQKEPKISISYTKECLHRPLLDCPYLHLHKDGVLVLNSIDSTTGRWSDRKIEKAFDDLFQS